MKKLLSLLLVFIMCFVLFACGNTETTEGGSTGTSSTTETTAPTEVTPTEGTTKPPKEGTTPLLYKVTDKDGNVIWLFGSIHVGREEFYPLPSYVLDAFDGADSLAVEADIVAFEKDMNRQMQAMSCLIYLDGTTIKDHISQELYNKSVDILKKYNTYMSALDMYCPEFWSSLIQSLQIEELGADISLGIDRHLLKRAGEVGKEIIEIESAEFQYQMMADFSEELQEVLLEGTVEGYENPDETLADLEKMMDLWASGDEKAFADYLNGTEEDLPPEEEKLLEEYNQAMIVERNLNMADYAEDALQSGKEIFICVGAAHIVGDGAVAQLLSQRGYTVECITK